MKKFMLTLAILLSLSNFVFAQSTGTTTSPIGISIVNALSITKASGSLMFPEIIMNGTVQTKAITNANGVRFLIMGRPNRNVTVTYDATDVLNNNAYVTANGGTQGTYTSPTAITSGSTLPLVNDLGFGKLNLWVGGSISCSTTQPNGDYVGTFNVSVTY
jgi:hypothetical protein